jgi:hypothetical protein
MVLATGRLIHEPDEGVRSPPPLVGEGQGGGGEAVGLGPAATSRALPPTLALPHRGEGGKWTVPAGTCMSDCDAGRSLEIPTRPASRFPPSLLREDVREVTIGGTPRFRPRNEDSASMPHKPELNRRALLRTAAAAGLASALGSQVANVSAAPSSTSTPTPARPDLIRRENEVPGTRDWIATNVRIDPKGPRRPAPAPPRIVPRPSAARPADRLRASPRV